MLHVEPAAVCTVYTFNDLSFEFNVWKAEYGYVLLEKCTTIWDDTSTLINCTVSDSLRFCFFLHKIEMSQFNLVRENSFREREKNSFAVEN